MLFAQEKVSVRSVKARRATAVMLLAGALGIGATDVSSLAGAAEIEVRRDAVLFRAHPLTRRLNAAGGNLKCESFQVDGEELLRSEVEEFSVIVRFATPNRAPVGVRPGESGAEPVSAKEMDFPMNCLRQEDAEYLDTRGVEWIDPILIDSRTWRRRFRTLDLQALHPSPGVTRLEAAAGSAVGRLRGLQCELVYEVYDDFPVVRKWVRIANRGDKWIKLDHLRIEGLALKPQFAHRTPLAPGAFDGQGLAPLDGDNASPPDEGSLRSVIGPSVVAFGAKDGSTGVIATSEIPSAMRQINKDGSMGYRSELFEWVLGPLEEFVSEPVFYFAYSGPTWNTASAPSTARDRAVERSYQDFLSRRVGVAADRVDLNPPLWSVWEAAWRNVNDKVVREQAEIAVRCGFKRFEVDAGWQWDNLGTRIDREKFPNFLDTCRYLQSLGLQVSLWVSNYRSKGSKDLEIKPDARAAPLRTKQRKLGPGYGMSYCSSWKRHFAQEMIRLHQDYGIIGFKEDHTNIRAGDIGLDHESRTRKESLLRGFRGLFEVQDLVRQAAPDVLTEISHENYWDNPSPGCDIAALKHSVSYHIPPNTHYGSEDIFLRAKGKKLGAAYYGAAKSADAGAAARRQALITGCRIARERMYAHRALPLRCLQFYALITVNGHGRLTPRIQDRQICSLLMGAPFLFAGDLTTLSEENINHYAKRFKLLERLNRRYDIYRYFQFSGAPGPTDVGWHWWGKLNRDGCGAVVVLRGGGGEDRRVINIPWVQSDRTYRVTACFAEAELGTFAGRRLQEGVLALALPAYGQEILELRAKKGSGLNGASACGARVYDGAPRLGVERVAR